MHVTAGTIPYPRVQPASSPITSKIHASHRPCSRVIVKWVFYQEARRNHDSGLPGLMPALHTTYSGLNRTGNLGFWPKPVAWTIPQISNDLEASLSCERNHQHAKSKRPNKVPNSYMCSKLRFNTNYELCGNSSHYGPYLTLAMFVNVGGEQSVV